MGTSSSFLIFALFLLSSTLSLSAPLAFHSISPNISASFNKFIDTSGAFLSSINGTFRAAITNVNPEHRSYYFVVIHTLSHTVVWAANRNSPVSDSAELRLSPRGFALFDDSGKPVWSIPPSAVSVSSLQLLDSGNLLLLDSSNNSVWESFDYPTDTIVLGQRLLVGKSLLGSLKEGDLSEGDYEFTLTDNDAVFLWRKMVYWKLSMYKEAFRDTNARVEYAELRSDGIFLLGSNGTEIAIKVTLQSPDFTVLKIESSGALSTVRLNRDGGEVSGFNAPADICRIPLVCRSLGVCASGRCSSCPPGFHTDPTADGGCVPVNGKLSLPGNSSSCNSTTESVSAISYMKLGSGMDYFANDFTDPVAVGVNLSTCEDLCSKNCSCVAIFHSQSSGSCYMVRDYIGSIMKKSGSNGRLGYIKLTMDPNDEPEDGNRNIPLAALVLVPSSVVVFLALLIACVIVWIIRWKNSGKIKGKAKRKLSRRSSSWELEDVSIPGLPVRLDYEELMDATENLGTQIGSGGFGTVYKGTLSDGAVVAVKKMSCLGVHGKREFCTEIAIIGQIHHVNLVRLKGFCAHRESRYLVYEYMNRSSLDRALFGNGVPVLEWRDRFEIALGTARGLAYLHTGCEHKIIHCDVKPENILLHDNLLVKISDFGLSKLLSPEQSSWFTTLRGTRGYLAPEWLTNTAITEKTDVYSYGMVLLELISGKKNCSLSTPSHSNISNRGEGGVEYFPLRALEMHKEGRYLELLDPRLAGQVQMEDVEKLVRVALCCVHEDPMLRPTMTNVVGMLEGGMPLGDPQLESLNFLFFYGRRFTEASVVEGGSNQSVVHLYPQAMANMGSTGTTTSYFSSYMSSHQLSGPR